MGTQHKVDITEAESRVCPWSDLDPDGHSLIVHDFLTKRLSTLMITLRRQVTLPYARANHLSIVEWRLLSLIAHSGSLPFGELVVQSTSDKAQVSRTVRMLERRGLVTTQPETEHAKKKLSCTVTSVGLDLYGKVIREARRAQAQTLLLLSQDEREVLFGVIEKLQARLDG